MEASKVNEEIPFTVEYWVKRDKTFTVSAKCWRNGDKWMWNVYAYIFDNHPLFSKPGLAKVLPFNCGCTFDEIVTSEPSEGIKYDWQKTKRKLVVGSDYAHIHDDYENHPSPIHGVPGNILFDAKELVDALLSYLPQISETKAITQQ